MLPLQERFERFQARTAPTPAYIVEARAMCTSCRTLFNTQIFVASGSSLTPRVLLECAWAQCPRCATVESQEEAR
jgi:K+-transporting ATPase c subunit